MARPKITTARLTLEDFRRLGVRPHEFRSIVIRQAAVRKTRDLAKQQLASPSDQVGLQLARVATTTYRLLDPRLRDESTHSAYVGRILPQALSWASTTGFSRELSQFGAVPRESGLLPFEQPSLSDAELIETLDLDSPPLSRRMRSRQVRRRPTRPNRSRQIDANDWKASLSDADLLRPRRLKKWHARALGWLVVTAACLTFGVGGAAVYQWLDVGRAVAGGDTIVQTAVPSVGLADEGQSLNEQPLDHLASIDAKEAASRLAVAASAGTAQELTAQELTAQELLSGDGQISGQMVAEEMGRDAQRLPDEGPGSSLTPSDRVAVITPREPGDVPAIVATDRTPPGDRESSNGGRFDVNQDPNAVASADPELDAGSRSTGFLFPELNVSRDEVPFLEDVPDILMSGLAADPGISPPKLGALASDGAASDGAASDDVPADDTADVVAVDHEREEGEFGGAIISDPVPSDDSLWLARLELLRLMPQLDVPYEAKNAHLRILELELTGRKFQRIPAGYWVVQTLIAEAAWLVETVDDVEQRLGVLTSRYRVSPGKLLADTFISASPHATVPSTRDHLFQNGLRLCDKLLISSEPEYCKSVLGELDSLLPSEPDEARRSTVYLQDYLSAADEMIRYADGAEVVSDRSPIEQRESLGRYDCLLRRDWEKGLPGLVESSNELIARAAQGELALASKDEASDLKTVAEQWVVAASEATGRPADSMRLHALDLLRKARDRSSGLLTSEIDRQIDGLIEIVPEHLLPAEDWNPAWDSDPSRRNRPARRIAPVRSGQAL